MAAIRQSPKRPKAIVISPLPLEKEVRRAIQLFTAEAVRRGLEILRFDAKAAKEVSEENWTRPVRLLAPADAESIYQLLHHGPVLVAAFTSAFVRRDPRSRPLTRRQAIPIDRFVAYKAYFSLITGRTGISRSLDEFDAWRTNAACEGQDDPRILPLHTFLCTRHWDELDNPAVRTEFANEHGTGGRRIDAGGRPWERAIHGWDVLTVARHTLPRGLHWDVQFGERGVLHCANAVWSVRRGSHLNVYPDGGARGKPAGGYAKRIWP